MRIRGTWIALPAIAAVGAIGHTTITSWLAAAEPPPFGFYPTKVSPSQPGLVPAGGIPSTSMEPRTVNGQPVDWNPSKSKLTSPVVAGPTLEVPVKIVSPIRQAAASEPLGAPPIAKVAPPAITPPAIALPSVVPPVAPPAYMPTLPAPKPIPVPAPGAIGVPIAAPKLTVESSIPETKSAPRLLSPSGPSVPLSTNIAPSPIPTPNVEPTVTPPSSPALLKPVAAPPSLTTAMTAPPPATFPVTGLAAKNAPTVILEAIAPETVSVNQPLTYELVVRNTGAAAVANVRVEEEPPAGAKFLSSDPAAESFNGRLVWAIGTLEAGAEKRIKISVRPADEGEVRSRAVVSFSAATEARVKVTRPKLNLTMTALETARVGDEIAFTIRVANTGTGPASKMLLQANLTDGLNHAQGSVIETELANLPAGESRTLTLRTLATKAGSQGLALSVTADGNAAETSKATVAVVEPMLAARMAGPAKCLVRSEPEFKIELANAGTAATDAIVATAAIPDGFDFVSASDSGTLQPATRTVVWKLPALGASSKKEVSLKLKATGIAEGTVKLVVQSGTAEPAEGLTPASARVGRTLEAKTEGAIKAEGVSALRFEVTDVDDPIEVGKEAVYEIKVVNQGTAPCTNVQIAATLADGTTATGANGPTQARGQGQQVTFDSLATLGTKQEAIFKVKVKGGVAGDQRFRVQVTCDQNRTPITKEESTRFVKD